jgi:group I intron endonuclease
MNTKVLLFPNFFDLKSLIIKTVRGFAGVYILQNKLNGKRYVGSSINLASRLRSYFYTGLGSSNYGMVIYWALLKHGCDNFSLTVILLPNASKEAVLALEQYCIDTLRPDYNVSPTAGSSAGLKHTPEHNDQIRISMMGHSTTEDTRKLMSDAKKGENNPSFGKAPVNTQVVLLTDLDGNVIKEFASMTLLGAYFNVSKQTISKYVQTGKVFRDKYIFLRKS